MDLFSQNKHALSGFPEFPIFVHKTLFNVELLPVDQKNQYFIFPLLNAIKIAWFAIFSSTQNLFK